MKQNMGVADRIISGNMDHCPYLVTNRCNWILPIYAIFGIRTTTKKKLN